jgi:HK97 family phage major capsid protein|nr:MAG TPA: major capsid protein [Caudoviricetes sp.]
MKMNIQFFAGDGKGKDNIKALRETRAEKVEELKFLYATLESEERAITEDEEKRAESINDEIKRIDKTIVILNEMKKNIEERGEREEPEDDPEKKEEKRAEDEERALADYIRGVVTDEHRAENLTKTDNGALIPQTIANKIIKKVYDISPILEKTTKYNVKGELKIPKYKADADNIVMAYNDEFTELESKAGKFTTISLTGYLSGVLSLLSNSLINNSQFDIVSFVIDQMAYNVSRFIEKELLIGTDQKIEGLKGVTLATTAAKATVIKADELIDLQDSIKDAFQQNAMWIMNSKTRTAIRKLKDNNGRYLLQDDVNSPFGKTLLGKPIYCSDNMPELAASATTIYYGDMSGLAVKIVEALEINVLREKFATQHATGIVGWMEMDAKVENEQKIAKMVMGAE